MKNDLISRQAAIDDINRALPDWSEDKETAIDCLRNLPSVDAVPVVPELAPVIEELKTMYAIAKDQMRIRNPVLWSLYQVWQKRSMRAWRDGDEERH